MKNLWYLLASIYINILLSVTTTQRETNLAAGEIEIIALCFLSAEEVCESNKLSPMFLLLTIEYIKYEMFLFLGANKLTLFASKAKPNVL